MGEFFHVTIKIAQVTFVKKDHMLLQITFE